MKAKLFMSVSAAALFALPVCANAQTTRPADRSAEEGARNNEDIIVTATRRTERLQDVPLSVSAFAQDDLDELGIVGYEGIAQNTPGVVINRPTQNFNNFTARGINTNGYSAGLQSAVAIYIDELPISANGNSTILDPNLYDVERVEFLRGPQGTLFGSNSLAGAMRIITKSPDLDDFEASASVDLGLTKSNSVRQRYNAMINVPIMKDAMALRVTGYYRNEDGWVDNVGTGIKNSNSLEAYGGRAILLMQPSDRMKVKLLASYENSKPADSGLINPARGTFVRLSDRPDLFQGELQNYNLTVNYEFDFAELISSTTLSNYDASFYVDLAGSYGQLFPFALDAFGWDDLFVQETRLVSRHDGPVEWVAGFFYYDKRRTVDFAYRSTPEYLKANGVVGLPDEYYQRFNAYTDSSEIAAFGELTFRFSDRFWVTGGLRYGNTKTQSFQRGGGYNSNYLSNAYCRALSAYWWIGPCYGNIPPLVVTETPYTEGLKISDDRLSWKASMSWKPVDSLTAYATVSTGFRTPVVNALAGLVSQIDPDDIVIPAGARSDSVTNYEVGLKGRWLNGDLTANIAGYYIDWKNIQVQANRVSDTIQFATNIGAAESYGLEFEIMARPVAGFSLALNGSINEAKVTKLTALEAAMSGATVGTRLASPHFQGSATARYDFAIGGGNRAYGAVNVAHVGSFPNQFPNVPGNPNAVMATYDYTDAWTNVNLYAGTTLGRLDLTAYAENVFDSKKITYVHPEAFIDGRYARMRPRTVGIRANYRF